jgi:hypothetical protein
MLTIEDDETVYRVQYRSFVFALIFLCLPPLMLIEYMPVLLDGSIESPQMIGLLLGVLLPLLGAYYLIEFSHFTFSKDDRVLSWAWRNLFRKKLGEVPFERIAMVRRDAMESGDSDGLQYSHRLVIMLDDGSMIPLTRGYSRLYSKKLDQVVDQIRDIIGHSSHER